jgi:hypothetical protein
MKIFLIKTGLFLLPVAVVIVYTIKFYNFEQGDLVRMSYLTSDYDYEKVFKGEYNSKDIVILNDSSVVKKKKWKFFTIGDSFTRQRKMGYVSKLSAKYPNNVVSFNTDYLLGGDPMTSLYGLINSDYFDSVKVEYVVFQSVERYLASRGVGLNRDVQYGYSKVEETILQQKKERLEGQQKSSTAKEPPYPTDRFVKFPLNNIMYLYNPMGNNEFVYKEMLTTPLFSTSRNDVLFYKEDIDFLEFNNNEDNVKKLNDNLNEVALALKKKGIQLIVLIAPDKFDLYYPYLVNKNNYTKPLFFEHFNQLEKNYLYVDAHTIFRDKLKQKAKDIYLYDDTHWSPWATKIVATEIAKISENSGH